MGDIGFLQEAIRNLHGCESIHVQTVPVKEVFRGEIVWQGDVEVFNLRGHPKAKQCYAWAYQKSDDKPDVEAVTILAVKPITSPRKAVQAYVASLARKPVLRQAWQEKQNRS